jgi:hypothetical protein
MHRWEEEVELTRQRTATASLSPSARVDLRQRIDKALQRRGAKIRLRLAGILTGALALAAGVAVVTLTLDESSWYRVLSGSECLVEVGDQLTVETCAAAVRLESDAGTEATLVLERGAKLDREGGRPRVRRGRVQVTAAAKPQAIPLRLDVSVGSILTLGATFAVEQGELAGQLVISEGRVDFVWANDLSRESLVAGQTLQWPRRASSPESRSAPVVPPDDRARRQESAKLPALDAVLETLFQLRSQKRYVDAGRLLRVALKRSDLGARQRERLSFELGLVLELSANREVCAHWREHVAAFARGDLADAATAKVAACAASNEAAR